MAVEVDLLNANSINNIDTNFQRVETALQDAVSRSGNTPNEMNADFDMNSHNIINVGLLSADDITINGNDISGILEEAQAAVDLAEAAALSADADAQAAEEAAVAAQAAAELVEDVIPVGGTTGQVLTKNSDSDYDLIWDDAAGGVSDGDKGDITVSSTGTVWEVNSGVINDDNIHTPLLPADAIASSKIRFNNGLLGGVSRFLNQKLDDFIDVKDFGAVGDGTTDDYDAILAAFNAAGSTKTIYFPDGEYYISQSIVRTTAFHIFGQSHAAVILTKSAINAIEISSASSSVMGGTMTNIRLASTVNTAGSRGIYVSGASNTFVALWSFNNIRLSGFYQAFNVMKGHGVSGGWNVSLCSVNTFNNIIIDEYNGSRTQFGLTGDGINTLTVTGGIIRAEIAGISFGSNTDATGIGFGDILITGVHFNFSTWCIIFTGSSNASTYKHNISFVACQFDGEIEGIRNIVQVDTYSERACNYGGAGAANSIPNSQVIQCRRVTIEQNSIENSVTTRKVFSGGNTQMDVIRLDAQGNTFKTAWVEVIAQGTVSGVGPSVTHRTFLMSLGNAAPVSIANGTETMQPGSGNRFSVGIAADGTDGLIRITLSGGAAADGTEVTVSCRVLSPDYVPIVIP